LKGQPHAKAQASNLPVSFAIILAFLKSYSKSLIMLTDQRMPSTAPIPAPNNKMLASSTPIFAKVFKIRAFIS